MNPNQSAPSVSIGVLSDTHGLLRPEVKRALAGCDRILHAGDIGDETLLQELGRIAPVVAVRGNMDYGAWSNALASTETIHIAGVVLYLIHDRYYLDLDPSAAGIDMVISGHTHRPELMQSDGVTFLNPGSAGHRRRNYPVSIARIRIQDGLITPRIIEIEISAP